jgi:hypothetical protein
MYAAGTSRQPLAVAGPPSANALPEQAGIPGTSAAHAFSTSLWQSADSVLLSINVKKVEATDMCDPARPPAQKQ